MALICLKPKENDAPSPEVLNNTMDKLLEAMFASLRTGDIISRYSNTQFLVLLYAANYENSIMVMNRIVNAFLNACRDTKFYISYEVRDLMAFE